MAEPRNDELYIGYLPAAPPDVAAQVRRAVILLFALAVVTALLLVFAQGGFSAAVYEFGVRRDFAGVIRERPYPTLEMTRPGTVRGSVARRSRFYLVAPGKAGSAGEVAGLDGRRVRLEGSLIYRDDQTMIEIVPGTVEAVDGAAGRQPAGESLGVQTLVGRIVDSKCYLGVMKPGSTKPHRACAANCIRGGIPPLFVVQEESGSAARLLLVGGDGRAVNGEILEMVDEPLEITGEVVREGDLLVLRADPETYRRL